MHTRQGKASKQLRNHTVWEKQAVTWIFISIISFPSPTDPISQFLHTGNAQYWLRGEFPCSCHPYSIHHHKHIRTQSLRRNLHSRPERKTETLTSSILFSPYVSIHISFPFLTYFFLAFIPFLLFFSISVRYFFYTFLTLTPTSDWHWNTHIPPTFPDCVCLYWIPLSLTTFLIPNHAFSDCISYTEFLFADCVSFIILLNIIVSSQFSTQKPFPKPTFQQYLCIVNCF